MQEALHLFLLFMQQSTIFCNAMYLCTRNFNDLSLAAAFIGLVTKFHGTYASTSNNNNMIHIQHHYVAILLINVTLLSAMMDFVMRTRGQSHS